MKFLSHYLKENEKYDAEGQKLADKYDLIYNGWWDDMEEFTFTDKKLESTFTAKDELELISKLKEMRRVFANA